MVTEAQVASFMELSDGTATDICLVIRDPGRRVGTGCSHLPWPPEDYFVALSWTECSVPKKDPTMRP